MERSARGKVCPTSRDGPPGLAAPPVANVSCRGFARIAVTDQCERLFAHERMVLGCE
jgi:hypothetical protein